MHEAQHDRGERLVDLEQVDVVDASGRPWRAPCAAAGAGPVSMIVGSAPDTAVATMRARGVEAELLADLLVADHHQRGAVDDARRVAAVCTWSIASTQWYFCSATASKPPMLAHLANDGLSCAEASRASCRADELVVVEDDVGRSGPRPGRPSGEVARRPAARRAAASGRRSASTSSRREALERRDQVGADALRDERGVVVRSPGPWPRRRRPSPSARATSTRRRRRGRGPPSPDAHLLRRDVHGFETGRAEAVDLHAGDGLRQAGLDRRGLGDVGALVADRRHAAEHDVVDAGGIEALVAVEQLVHQADDEVDRLDRVQRPVLLPLPRGVRTASNTHASVAAIRIPSWIEVLAGQ